jgi:hypothetical protein
MRSFGVPTPRTMITLRLALTASGLARQICLGSQYLAQVLHTFIGIANAQCVSKDTHHQLKDKTELPLMCMSFRTKDFKESPQMNRRPRPYHKYFHSLYMEPVFGTWSQSKACFEVRSKGRIQTGLPQVAYLGHRPNGYRQQSTSHTQWMLISTQPPAKPCHTCKASILLFCHIYVFPVTYKLALSSEEQVPR